jgi:hypothetical protein
MMAVSSLREHPRNPARTILERRGSIPLLEPPYLVPVDNSNSQTVETFLMTPYSYPVDDTPGLGLRWEGVGAISGGGATTKLLMDYDSNIASDSAPSEI